MDEADLFDARVLRQGVREKAHTSHDEEERTGTDARVLRSTV